MTERKRKPMPVVKLTPEIAERALQILDSPRPHRGRTPSINCPFKCLVCGTGTETKEQADKCCSGRTENESVKPAQNTPHPSPYPVKGRIGKGMVPKYNNSVTRRFSW